MDLFQQLDVPVLRHMGLADHFRQLDVSVSRHMGHAGLLQVLRAVVALHMDPFLQEHGVQVVVPHMGLFRQLDVSVSQHMGHVDLLQVLHEVQELLQGRFPLLLEERVQLRMGLAQHRGLAQRKDLAGVEVGQHTDQLQDELVALHMGRASVDDKQHKDLQRKDHVRELCKDLQL